MGRYVPSREGPEQMRERLRQRRLALRLTQAEVAARVGIDRTAYNKIEIGVNTPRLDLAHRIAQVLGVSIEEVFFPTAGGIESADSAAQSESG
jgi:putative transcriptional regulator